MSVFGSPRAGSLFSFLEVVKMNSLGRFDMELAARGLAMLREEQRREIRRAIEHVKWRSMADEWFREEWHRSVALRRRSGNKWQPDNGGGFTLRPVVRVWRPGCRRGR